MLNRDPNFRSIDKNTTVLVDLDTQLSRNENVFGNRQLANNFDQTHFINEFNSKYRNTSQSKSPDFKLMETVDRSEFITQGSSLVKENAFQMDYDWVKN